jgi:hypothetical protein
MIRSIRAAVADDSLPWLGTDRRAAGTHQSTVTRLEVGPNYERPLVGPLTISVSGGGIRGPSLWEVLVDPALQDLVRRAPVGDYGLQAAVASVERGRAHIGAFLSPPTRSPRLL